MVHARPGPPPPHASTSAAAAAAYRPRLQSADDEIELDTSPPSRSASPLPRKEVSFHPHHLQDYGAMSTPRRSLENTDAAAPRDHDDAGSTASDHSLLAELEHALVAPDAPKSERWERAFALLVACLLSVGSHYGSYLLGPLKNRLRNEQGVSNTQFSLLLAALSLNNTWTPLVGGLLTAKIGTPRASILATGVIFAGQLLVLLSTGSGQGEDSKGSIRGMAAGLFIFGLGVSPLAVVQETIIVRYFSNHGLGVSLALGLVAGKGASFLSSVTSYPLSERYGTRGPFAVSTSLAGLSFAVNILYLVFHARLHPAAAAGSGDDARKSDEAAAERVIQRRKVKLMNLSKLGDVFWLYILMNVFSGAIWSPFLHLASNIVQRRFQLPDAQSASYASLLLAGAIFLYPLAGFIHDLSHRRHGDASSPGGRQAHGPSTIVYRLLTIASCLTLACFAWLVAPAQWTTTPVPALISFGVGHGFATLLLVLVVPGIVDSEWVSTALGTHKSMESAATTFAQTLSGLLLDKVAKPKGGAPSSDLRPDGPIPRSTVGTWLLLATFLAINVLQLLTILGLWRAFARRSRTNDVGDRTGAAYAPLPKVDDEGDADDAHARHPSGEADVGDGPEANGGARRASYDQHPSRTLSASSRRPLLWSESASVASSTGSVEHALDLAATAEVHDCSAAELQRGRWFFGASVAFLVVVWATFGAVSLLKG